MRIKSLILIFLLSSAICGCATLKERTLPANFEPTYDFPAYTLNPSGDPTWRFLYKDRDLQSIAFINSVNKSRIFIEITPVFNNIIPEEKNIIEYFQNKTLKELKLSPDIALSEQAIQTREENISSGIYKILSIPYKVKNDSFELTIYYNLIPENDILYEFILLKSNETLSNVSFKVRTEMDFQSLIKNIKFKKPKEKDMIDLRVNYAFSDFLQAAQDKYLKEKSEELKKKYDNAVREAKNWLTLGSGYEAYNLLGYLYIYNDKFERYGEGFDYFGALKNFKKAIELRKCFKAAHLNLAQLYKATGKNNQALEEYLVATQISPNDENVYYEIGKLYESTGDKKNARTFYEKAIRHWGSGFETLDELKNKLKKWEKEKPEKQKSEKQEQKYPITLEPKLPIVQKGVPPISASVFPIQNYADYYRMVYKTISKAVVKPEGTTSGTINVSFTLLADGTLQDVEILESSSQDPALRAAVEKAIRDSAPFPAFPEDIKAEAKKKFTITLEFRNK